MTVEIKCKDLLKDCSFIFSGETMDEVITQCREHGKTVHGFTDEEMNAPEMTEKISSLFHKV